MLMQKSEQHKNGKAGPVAARMFDAAAHKVECRHSPLKIAVLSIDVEHDFNGDKSEALNRLPDLLAALQCTGLPLTAFVEGRLFVERPDLCGCLVEAEADLHLHCYDHRLSGETAESLKAGIDAFSCFVGTRPEGYRANTYHLTEALFRSLVAEGFAWDSSILPGIGLGAHADKAFRRGDWFLLDDVIAELPVASWRRFGIPFTQSYRQLMGPFAESLLHRMAPLPDLLVYNMHMVDLVPDGHIRESPESLWLKGLHALARQRQHGFDGLADLGERLIKQGYQWVTMTRCYELLTKEGP